MERLPSDLEVYVMYDVACNLVRHLRAKEDGQYLLQCLKFAIPAFHAHGHNAPCQVSKQRTSLWRNTWVLHLGIAL